MKITLSNNDTEILSDLCARQDYSDQLKVLAQLLLENSEITLVIEED